MTYRLYVTALESFKLKLYVCNPASGRMSHPQNMTINHMVSINAVINLNYNAHQKSPKLKKLEVVNFTYSDAKLYF